jgi:hypothetical protein
MDSTESRSFMMNFKSRTKISVPPSGKIVTIIPQSIDSANFMDLKSTLRDDLNLLEIDRLFSNPEGFHHRVSLLF